MFERYTQRALRSLFFARSAVSELGSEAITSDHLLLGLLREEEGITARILHPSRDALTREIRAKTPQTGTPIATNVEIPFSAAVQDVLNIAKEEADRMHHAHIGDEHLLLAILVEGTSLAASVLREHGFDVETIRQVMTRPTSALDRGLRLPDKTGEEIIYRYLRKTDDVDAITEMLHEAYARLAAKGMRFFASYQDSAATRRRMAQGETILAEHEGLVVGTITLKNAEATKGSPFYNRPDVAAFEQFAVRTSHQRRGIGSTLIELVEQRALEQGVSSLALDTSENARDLINVYTAKGYRFVEHAQWEKVNYRSVILAKELLPLKHAKGVIISGQAKPI